MRAEEDGGGRTESGKEPQKNGRQSMEGSSSICQVARAGQTLAIGGSQDTTIKRRTPAKEGLGGPSPTPNQREAETENKGF